MESEELDLDMDFLRSVDEAVSSALSTKSKRQRLTLPSSPSSVNEGAYISALKGSHGVHWKESVTDAPTSEADLRRKRTAGGNQAEGGCFKCGEMGHWARDCPRSGGGGVGNEEAEGKGEEELSKECPCGAGRCSVLTSNTAKNPGRKFFRCPVKSDMGGCNFFEWCDTPQNMSQNQIHTTNQANPNAAGMLCPCGAGSCLILTTKNGPNAGRQFYRCPANSDGGSCGFFKWYETDQTPQPTQFKPSPQSHSFRSHSSGQIPIGGHGSSSCYKCGGEGHWARDCPNQTPDHKTNKHLPSYGTSSGSSFGSGSGTCFSCGQAGHWSRDCPSKSYGVRK